AGEDDPARPTPRHVLGDAEPEPRIGARDEHGVAVESDVRREGADGGFDLALIEDARDGRGERVAVACRVHCGSDPSKDRDRASPGIVLESEISRASTRP